MYMLIIATRGCSPVLWPGPACQSVHALVSFMIHGQSQSSPSFSMIPASACVWGLLGRLCRDIPDAVCWLCAGQPRPKIQCQPYIPVIDRSKSGQ